MVVVAATGELDLDPGGHSGRSAYRSTCRGRRLTPRGVAGGTVLTVCQNCAHGDQRVPPEGRQTIGGTDGRQRRPAAPARPAHRARRRGTTFVRSIAGPSGAPTVVLVHGWLASGGLNWFQTFDDLRGRYRVMPPTCVATAGACGLAAGSRLADCADDLAAMIERARLRAGRSSSATRWAVRWPSCSGSGTASWWPAWCSSPRRPASSPGCGSASSSPPPWRRPPAGPGPASRSPACRSGPSVSGSPPTARATRAMGRWAAAEMQRHNPRTDPGGRSGHRQLQRPPLGRRHRCARPRASITIRDLAIRPPSRLGSRSPSPARPSTGSRTATPRVPGPGSARRSALAVDDVAVPPVTGGPLDGVRIVELGGLGPAPFAAMALADLGADVVRVVRPGQGGDGAIGRFDVLNRNRDTIEVDCKVAAGRGDRARSRRRGRRLHRGLPARGLRAARDWVRPTPRAQSPAGVRPDDGMGPGRPLRRQAGHDITYAAMAGAIGHIGRRRTSPHAPAEPGGRLRRGRDVARVRRMAAAMIQARAGGDGPGRRRGHGRRGRHAHGGVDRRPRERVLVRRAGDQPARLRRPFYDCYPCADGGT